MNILSKFIQVYKNHSSIQIISFIFTCILLLLCIGLIQHQRIIYGSLFGVIQFSILFFLMFAISGKLFKSLNFSAVVLLLLFLTNRLSFHYFKKPLFLSDFIVFSNPDNWDTILQYKELILVILIYLILLSFAIFAYSKNAKKYSFKVRISSIIILILLLISHQNLITQQKIKDSWLSTFPDLKDTFFNFSMSLGNISYESPQFGNHFDYFKTQLAQIAPYPTSQLKPNLILWLNESTVDASLFQGNLPQNSMFATQANTKFNSLIRVHTFGGGTYKSEYEALSGLSPDDFGIYSSLVFYSVAKHTHFSLPKILKEQGYKTVVLNPFMPNNYNAGEAYKYLGFDEHYHPTDLGFAAKRTNLWRISSIDMANLIKKIFDESDKPVFIYVLSMKEHGPYDQAKQVDFGLEQIYDNKTALQTTDYYQRQIELNQAVEDLDQFLLNSQKEYVLAYFGDHQPSLGLQTNHLNIPHNDPFKITNFTVRGSKNITPIKSPTLSELNLMPSVLLELMQISPNSFFQANYAMRKLCENNGGGVDDCQDKTLAQSYKSYVYDYLKAAE